MVSALSRPYPFKLFKGFLSHILLGPFFNTLSHILIMFSNICNMLTMFSNMFSNICKHANTAIAITLVLETFAFKWHEPVSPQVLLAKWPCDKIDLFSVSKLNCAVDLKLYRLSLFLFGNLFSFFKIPKIDLQYMKISSMLSLLQTNKT